VYTKRLPTTFIRRMERNQGLGVIRAQGLNLISHSTMPNLIPINIREYNGFIVRRRHYPIKRSNKGGCRRCQKGDLWLLRMNNHRMLTSSRMRWRRTWTCEFLERIRGEINNELQISCRTCLRSGARSSRGWRACSWTRVVCSKKLEKCNSEGGESVPA